MLRTSLLLYLGVIQSWAAISLERIPDSWAEAEPPAGLHSVLRERGMTCEHFYSRAEEAATLAYITRPLFFPYLMENYRDAIAGMQHGYAGSAKKAGLVVRKNEVVSPNGIELLHQELVQGDFVVCNVTQFSSAGLEQIVITAPKESYDASLAMVYGLFDKVAPPVSASSGGGRSHAYESGLAVGKILGWMALIGVAVIVIVVLRARSSASRAASPSAFSVDALKASPPSKVGEEERE